MDRTERRQRIRDLREWIIDCDTEWRDDAEWPAEVTEAFEVNRRELRDLVADDLADGYAAGRLQREGGSDPGRQVRTDDPRIPGHVRADQSRALATVERYADHLGARAGDALDGLIRSDKTGIGSRYLHAVGDPAYNSAFGKLLANPTTGHWQLTREESEAIQLVNHIEAERVVQGHGTGAQGAFALPFTLDPTILLTSGGSVNPIRDLADVELVSTDQWKGVSADTPTAGGYAAELTEASDASPVLAQPVIQTQKGQLFVPFSIEVGQDWATIQGEIGKLLADERNQKDAAAFLTGTGTNEPGGVLNIGGTGGLTTTQRIQTATLNTTVLSDLYVFEQAIPARFYGDAVWAMNRVVGDVFYRFVAAGSTTEPQIFTQGRDGPLLGKPVREWSTMLTATTTTTTTTTKIAILGDWKSYKIVDRIGAQMELIPHLFGSGNRYPIGARGFYYYWRTGAGVVKPNGLRYLEVK